MELSKLIYTEGETLLVNLRLSNNSKLKVRQIDIALVQHSVFKSKTLREVSHPYINNNISKALKVQNKLNICFFQKNKWLFINTIMLDAPELIMFSISQEVRVFSVYFCAIKLVQNVYISTVSILWRDNSKE